MNFADAFRDGARKSRSLLLPYMMTGLPDASCTVDLFMAMADGGADGFEVGIPYADPLMDGPVIQAAGAKSLAGGMTMTIGLRLVEEIAKRVDVPLAVMTYVNPVLRRGITEFARQVASTGATALIVADLPVDESSELAEACRAAGVGLVQFAAPTTDSARLDAVVAANPPFVYGIAEVGVTGERAKASVRAPSMVAAIRERSEVPVVLGVGISTAEAAASAAGIADGVIVGSALVRRVMEAGSSAEAATSLHRAVKELAAAMVRA